MNRKLIIMRGMPGSGKSFLAKKLAGEAGKVFSADDYFSRNGEYNWVGSELPNAHIDCQNRALEAMYLAIPVVVIDNTNITLWELKQLRHLIEIAQVLGYEVEIREPNTPWAWDAEELVKRNTHGVTLKKMNKFIGRYAKNVTVEDILSPEDRKLRSA